MSDRRIFLRQVGATAIGIRLLQSLPVIVQANLLQRPILLSRSTPESQGISSAGISKFLTAIKESGKEFHSLMILPHGHVVAEGWWAPYSSEHRQQLYSLSKSFTSTAIGLAVAEGLLSVEDPIIKFFLNCYRILLVITLPH